MDHLHKWRMGYDVDAFCDYKDCEVVLDPRQIEERLDLLEEFFDLFRKEDISVSFGKHLTDNLFETISQKMLELFIEAMKKETK